MDDDDRGDLADLLTAVPAWELPAPAWPRVAVALQRLGAALDSDGDGAEIGAAWGELAANAPLRIERGLHRALTSPPREPAPPGTLDVVTKLLRRLGTAPPAETPRSADGSA
ncbi:CATRA system-associated protein [Micromonosporaceae bacterium Da 78-11]